MCSVACRPTLPGCSGGDSSALADRERLHWSLDVAFGEDDSQVRSGNAADNLGRVRRLALSVLKQDDRIDGGTETKRLRAGWDTEYLEHLLGQL